MDFGQSFKMSRVQRSPPSRSDLTHSVSESDVPYLLEQDTIPFVTQRAKRPRETCCEDSLLKFKEEVKSMIQDMNNNQNLILNKLIGDIAEIKTQNSTIQKSNHDIEKSLQFLSDQFDNMSTRVGALEKERKEHLLHISTLEAKVEEMQRSLKSTTVEIRNVPSQPKLESVTDLTNIVLNTCKVLDVNAQISDIKDVFRVKGKAGSTTIVTDFTRVTKQQEVVKSAKTYNKAHPTDRLNSNHIGIPGLSTPIYISEGLTAKGRRLLYLARDFASSTGYKYCWTSNGKVYVRKADSSPHTEIKNEADLVNLKNQK